MTVIIFLLFLLIAISIIFYSIIKFLLDPRRKLEAAHHSGKFFLLDDPENVRKNILVTYRNVLFEGEKYLGAANDSFEVTSVILWTEDMADLKGLSRKDFYFVEKEILVHYPKAEIEWKSPIKEFLKRIENKNND